jgi:hypothetical protein
MLFGWTTTGIKHLACKGKIKNANKILIGIQKEKKQFEVWDNIKTCQLSYQVVSSVRLAKSRD